MSQNSANFSFAADTTAIFLCDIQECFRPHIKHFGEGVKVANKMIDASKALNIPVYIAEQYPKGLGHTSKDVKVESAALLLEKTKFSMYTSELKEKLWQDVPRLKTVILTGFETHVCIEQTVIDLVQEGIEVHVLADGVSSRSFMDRELALQRFQKYPGCYVTTSESVLFRLLKDKNHPAFKVISKLNREPTVDIGYNVAKL